MISVEVLHGKDTMLFEEWFGVLSLEEFIIESLLEERPDSSTSFELIKVCLFVPKEDSDAMLWAIQIFVVLFITESIMY